MIILYSLCVALFIVVGQALWKVAVTNVGKTDVALASVDGILKLLLSWQLIVGVLAYGIATIAYILLLGKYKYFQVQSIVVGGSLVFTILISTLLFKDHASVTNIMGVGLILAGALLVVR